MKRDNFNSTTYADAEDVDFNGFDGSFEQSYQDEVFDEFLGGDSKARKARTNELIASGMSKKDAQKQALIDFPPTGAGKALRDTWNKAKEVATDVIGNAASSKLGNAISTGEGEGTGSDSNEAEGKKMPTWAWYAIGVAAVGTIAFVILRR